MAINHLDDLAAELIAAGIMTNSEQNEPGVWSGDIDTSRYDSTDNNYYVLLNDIHHDMQRRIRINLKDFKLFNLEYSIMTKHHSSLVMVLMVLLQD